MATAHVDRALRAPPSKVKIPNCGEMLVREEGPGILNWALQGLHPLLCDIEETGDIRLTPRQAGVVDSQLAGSNSLRVFLRDHVVKESGSDLSVSEIIQAYAHFCPDQGWDPLPESQIGPTTAHAHAGTRFPSTAMSARYIAIESNPRTREMYARYEIPGFWVTEKGTCLTEGTRKVKRLSPCPH